MDPGRSAAPRRCGWCDSTHVADAHACTCAEDCGVGWCCAAEDLKVAAGGASGRWL